jgi:hypothetical protein
MAPILSGSSVVAFAVIALKSIIAQKWAEWAAESALMAKEQVPSLVVALELVAVTFQVSFSLIS